MRILAVGGGSGGHVTPVVAVLREIRKSHPKTEIRFWCDKKFIHQAKNIINNYDNDILVQTIIAGKLRRYHHLSVLRQLLWPSLVLKNARDVFYVLAGFSQSFIMLLIWRPNAIFAKGGYVCLPVGIAARILNIPIVLHDSDAHPGLTNRIISKWAVKIATGAPLKFYPYPSYKSSYVGIPIVPEFHKFNKEQRLSARQEWGIKTDQPLIVVTGGGLGASVINDAVVLSLENLNKIGSVILISGSMQYDELRSLTPPNSDNFQLHSFVSKNMASLLASADVVIARAGATTILELAAVETPTILIPNAKLTGGHQLKNAKVYKDKNAVVVLNEDDIINKPELLVESVKDIISNPDKAKAMSKRFSNFSRPNAAKDVADMVISATK